VGNQSEWYTILASPRAAAATALARSMGVGDADEVSSFTAPNDIALSSVSNATAVSLSVSPVGAVKAGRFAQHDDVTHGALAAWLPTTRLRIPELDALTESLRMMLERQLKTARPRTKLEIGAHVEQLVTVEDGHVWRHETTLAPGAKDARRFDTSTGLVREEGVIDREGHFGAEGESCTYCDGRVCGLCASGLVSCNCCDAPICRRCVRKPDADLWLCPACATMRAPTRSEARQHGRLLLTRGMLVGIDNQHVVVVEQAKHRWTRQGEDGKKHAIASPSVSKFLAERLAGPDTTPAES